MTEETPVKVMSLLGVAVFSMFLLFAVSATNASFNGPETALPNIAAPQQVMAALDIASNSYSNFLEANLFRPAEQEYAFVADNANYVAQEAGPQIMAFTGLEGLEHVSQPQPQVAGAFIDQQQPSDQGLSVDSLYSFLIR